MTSVVGTLYYSCPEIIKHLPYNKKAGTMKTNIDSLKRFYFNQSDIWSLGCIIYQMVALVLPFFTSNILLLATHICNGDYDRKPMETRSPGINNMISQCLTVDPQLRPDTYGLANLCTEKLMMYTDRTCARVESLETRLRHRSMPDQSQLPKDLMSPSPRPLSSHMSKESLSNSVPDTAELKIDNNQDNHRDSSKIQPLSNGSLENLNFVY